MKTTDSTLMFDDLPSRPKSLAPNELAAVFGGCIQKGDSCANLDPKDNCCPGLGCLPDGVVCGKVD